MKMMELGLDACLWPVHGHNSDMITPLFADKGKAYMRTRSSESLYHAMICFVLLAGLLLSPVAAQDISSLPPACQVNITSPQFEPQCQQALLQSIQLSVNYYTSLFAEKFKFCVRNMDSDRNAAFDFRSNLTFLSTCLIESEGTILDRLCSGGEIKAYINSLVYLIASANSSLPVVSNTNCNETHWNQGCEDGWSSRLQDPVKETIDLFQNANSIPLRNEKTALSCCAGFFCPRGSSCMIPCPLGAQCLKSTLAGGLCIPYNYQVTPGMNFSCGGANLWADLSNSDGFFCPGGSYCPATTDVRPCNKGFFCRQGSTSPSKCFRLTSCDANTTTQHIQSYGVMLLVALATILFLVYSCSDLAMHIHEKHKIKTREKAARQVLEQLYAVERWKSSVNAAKRIHRTFSQKSQGLEETQPLPPFVELSNEARSKFHTIDEEGEEGTLPHAGMPSENRGMEEDLYVPVEVPPSSVGEESSSTKKRRTKSQILRYAYQEIEKEKVLQGKGSSLDATVKVQQEQHVNRRRQIEITFRDLSLFLKQNGKKILCDVTGQLLPGHVTAVMGPSGAGKTTFLNALAAKAYNSTITGQILVNGRPDPISWYKKIIGFVPQDDILHGNLTVEENLWFSARYRLSLSMSKADQVLVVERIIDSLGLGPVRNAMVGTVEKRGISGGQRKRVNVGLEMVMEPSLLILDEPTSGLDSTSSQFVLKALRREALVGVNVGVVLHQPSYGLFRLFDNVMFLAKGGRTIYFGPVEQVEEYFASLGIFVPERINPPDHVMDVLEGITKPEGNPGFDPRTLPVKWIQHNRYPMPADLQTIATSIEGSPEDAASRSEGTEVSRSATAQKSFTQELWQEFVSFWEMRWDDARSMFSRTEDLSGRRTPAFLSQFKLIIMRVALQRFREARLQTQDCLILLLCGACLGVITPSKDSSLGSNNYTYVIIALSLLCMISALRTFSNDKLQYWRESASGINRVAYFLAKDTVDHLNTVIKPVVFLSMFYFFNNPRSSFGENFLVTLALVYCVTGIAYFFAIIAGSGPAQLWSVFLPIVFTLIATKRDASGILKNFQYLTYPSWALEAYVIANAEKYSGVWLITRCEILAGGGYNLNHWALCLSILFIMGFLARCIAMLCLMLCNKERQQ